MLQAWNKYDLERLHKKTSETLHSYIRRFSETRNSIPNISDGDAISAFIRGLYFHDALRSKLHCKKPDSIADMLWIANSYADAEEADRQHKDIIARTRRSNRPPRR